MDKGVENVRGAKISKKTQGFPKEELENGGDLGNRRVLRDINNLPKESPQPSPILKNCFNGVVNKITRILVGQRPIARMFAPPQDLKSQDLLKALTKKQINNKKCDVPLPMVEGIEDMVHGELREVETEDLKAKLFKDIDSCDSNNSLAVDEYVDDIFSFMREIEESSCVPPDYMSSQFDINDRMRAILINWLIKVQCKFELVEETLFLTVNLIDRFLARQCVVRKKLQLVGVTAMLLACKYEEVFLPPMENFILISNRAYTREEVFEMESLMMHTLEFNLSVPTPHVFLRRFLKAAVSDTKLELLAFYIIELCLVEYEMLKYCPSMLAAAAVYTAQCSLNGFPLWNRTSELCSRYSEAHLLECSRLMVKLHQRADKGELTSVYNKYNTFKYGYAAKSSPAVFLLDV